MRDLLINEVQCVSGGNILTDVQALAQNGITAPEQTLSILCLCTGSVVGGFLGGWGVGLGMGIVVGWIGYDVYKSLNTATAK
ncbi:MAG: hypothetical protein JSR17_11050 [Proteobacteria bacterium]|nr:hypothetical protein [Pseudomonadota bacterium]